MYVQCKLTPYNDQSSSPYIIYFNLEGPLECLTLCLWQPTVPSNVRLENSFNQALYFYYAKRKHCASITSMNNFRVP